MYYYREDGTLARINAQLRMFHNDVIFDREQFYDRKGALIAGSTKSCTLKTGRAKKPDARFVPGPLPVYETTDRLPFYQSLIKELRISKFDESRNSAFRISHFRISLPLDPPAAFPHNLRLRCIQLSSDLPTNCSSPSSF